MAIRKTAAAAKAEETKATAVKTEEKAETADKTATKAAPKTTAAKTTAAKTTATKTAAKTVTKAAAAKTEEKAAPAKKTATKTAAKKAAKETVTKVYIEYNGAKVSVDEMIENVKLTYKGNGSNADIETLEVYVKPEENAAYFVVNGELEGNKMDVYFC